MNQVDRSYIHSEVVEHLAGSIPGNKELSTFISQRVDKHYPLLATRDKHDVINRLVHEIIGYGFLEELLQDKSINEIMINSAMSVYLDKSGSFSPVSLDVTDEDIIDVIHKIATQVGAQWDVSHPILDAWLPDGSRIHAVLPPIASDGPCLTIRRFVTHGFALEQFCQNDSQEQIVQNLIRDRKNIVVAGGTSSGKTTLLNCLIHEVPHDERIVSIEETAELSSDHPHWVRLLARSANSEGAGEVSVGDLVKASLRMRPDRIVVGEVRSAEAFDLIQALNTGHDGSFCTIHANGSEEVIQRLASLALFAHPGLDYRAIITQITYGVDAVLYVHRDRQSRRSIQSICLLNRENDRPVVTDCETGKSVYV